MKLTTPSQIFTKLFVAFSLVLTNLASAQTVSTPVVGFTTTVVKGRGSSGQSSFMSFVPVQLRKTPIFTGIGLATGTTVALEKALKKLGLETIEDLLYYFPVRYGDMAQVKNIVGLSKGDHALVYGLS